MSDRERFDPELGEARIKLRAVLAALDEALAASTELPARSAPTLADITEEIAVHRDALEIIAARQRALADNVQPGRRQIPFRELDRVRAESDRLAAESLALTQALARLEALREDLAKRSGA